MLTQLTDTRTVGRKDFEEFGRRIGMSGRLVKRELDFFATEHPLAMELIGRSFLSDPLKQTKNHIALQKTTEGHFCLKKVAIKEKATLKSL